MLMVVGRSLALLAAGRYASLATAWTRTAPLRSPQPAVLTCMLASLRSSTTGNCSADNIPAEEEKNGLRKYRVKWRTKRSSRPSATEARTSPGGDDVNDDGSASVCFVAYDGETLRTAALRRGVASPHNGRANLINCRGLGTCGTCAVEILSGRETSVDPPERNRVEELRFNLPPHSFHDNSRLRLACQVRVRGDIEVVKRTGFWGQRGGVADPSQPRHYFGEFEYLLDSKSPPDRQKLEAGSTSSR